MDAQSNDVILLNNKKIKIKNGAAANKIGILLIIMSILS